MNKNMKSDQMSDHFSGLQLTIIYIIDKCSKFSSVLAITAAPHKTYVSNM